MSPNFNSLKENKINIAAQNNTISSKVSDYVALTKIRLASLVVFSAAMGYLMLPAQFSWTVFTQLIAGGFLVTGSSNAFNQIIERELDKKMSRTQNRPMAQGRLSVTEGLIVASIFGGLGLFLLWQINIYSFILGLFALFSYVAIYTPLKRVTPLCVFVGAFPGSVPPMLGYVAASNSFGLEPGILFLVQFFWQFPHFWAIAWKANEDYLKAGFRMLPLSEGKTERSAWIILLFAMFMVPVSILPWAFEMTGNISMVLCVIASLAFAYPAFKLYKSQDDKDATRLMFVSFFYLPVVQIIYLLDKL